MRAKLDAARLRFVQIQGWISKFFQNSATVSAKMHAIPLSIRRGGTEMRPVGFRNGLTDGLTKQILDALEFFIS